MGMDQNPAPTCKVFVRSVVFDFVLCVLNVWNRCLLIALQKLMSEVSLCPQKKKKKIIYIYIYIYIFIIIIIIYYLLLLKGNPSRQDSKVLYCWGVREEERQEMMEK